MQIIFAHQPKTGGTTLVQAFRGAYGIDSVYLDHKPGERRPTNLDFAKYKVISGHFDIKKYKGVSQDQIFITFYRHPVQRLLSHYHYWLRTPRLASISKLCAWVQNSRPCYTEFAKKIVEENKNYCKRYRTEYFDFIGIYEKLDESYEKLLKIFPELELNSVEPARVNPEKSITDLYMLSESDNWELEKILEEEIFLYQRAKTIFAKQQK